MAKSAAASNSFQLGIHDIIQAKPESAGRVLRKQLYQPRDSLERIIAQFTVAIQEKRQLLARGLSSKEQQC